MILRKSIITKARKIKALTPVATTEAIRYLKRYQAHVVSIADQEANIKW
jgi:hypothetical protein